MANTFITPAIIAREALRLLQSNILTPHLMSRKYEADFSQNGQKVGDTINIRRRVQGVIQEFNGSNGDNQTDLVESQIPMQLEKHFDAGIAVTAKDYTLELEVFSEQIIAPYITQMAEQIDIYGLSKLLHIPQVAGLDTTTTLPTTLPNSIATMAQVEKTANDLKFPVSPRYQIISTEYKATLLGVDSFVEVDKSGADSALRHAQFNTIMGFNSFMGQNVPTAEHTAGTLTTAITAGTTAVGATTIAVDNGNEASGTYKIGDIIHIAGYGNVVVAADGNLTTNAGTITIQDPIRNTGAGAVGIADNAATTMFDATGTRECHGAIFHPDCMAFASVPLALPQSVPAEFIKDPATGMGIRVVYDYDRASKSDIINLDFLCGCIVADPRLGAQVVKGT